MKIRLVLRCAAAAALLVVSTGCPTEPSPDFLLALHYAPVIYQDTDDDNAAADYITDFNYDGNWIADDNWDNFDDNRGHLIAYVYYSVVETDDYSFVVYAFFHPRDWDVPTHENDMEGFLAIVEKDGSEYGRLIGVITVAHTDFWSYTPSGSPLGTGEETIDGTLTLDALDDGSTHPRISIQAKGHGVKAWPEYADNFGGDYIVYEPDLSRPYDGSLPPSGDPDAPVMYGLIDITGLFWYYQMEAFRDPERTETFAEWGTLKGDCATFQLITLRCQENQANLPWKWDDKGSSSTEPDSVPGGLLGLDPAWISDVYFSGFVAQDRYVSNDFLLDLQRAGFNRDHLPEGWPDGLDISELLARAPQRETDGLQGPKLGALVTIAP